MDEFCAITGVDADTSAMYMEMSGYDLDTAIQLFFSMNDSGGGGGGLVATTNPGSSVWPHDWINILFSPSSDPGSSSNFPSSWLQQGLQTSTNDSHASDWSGLSILQHKNGPCGVLAAYQGYLLAHLQRSSGLSPNVCISSDIACAAVYELLQTSAHGQEIVKVCSWTDPINGVGNTVNVVGGDDKALLSVIAQYLAPGGAVLLLYSVIHSFGIDVLTSQHPNLLPLLYGPNFLCTSALMNILLTGEARESLGAYDDFGAAISWNKPPATVGLLSGTEVELKMKIHDGLKFPQHEVYVLHGRDHFTTLLVVPVSLPVSVDASTSWTVAMPAPRPYQEASTDEDLITSAEPHQDVVTFRGVHFNGLPPAGPAITQVIVTAPNGVCRLNAPTASLGMPKEYKPVRNTIDCIVQASAMDKADYPKEWTRWRYEVALTVDDPENKSEERPSGLPSLPTFSLNGDEIDISQPWRCRECFETRFATMCFGQNDAGATHCQHCSRSREAAGWTLWLSYDEIPRDWQASIDRQYGPMFSTVLRTKWSQCLVHYEQGKDLPVV